MTGIYYPRCLTGSRHPSYVSFIVFRSVVNVFYPKIDKNEKREGIPLMFLFLVSNFRLLCFLYFPDL